MFKIVRYNWIKNSEKYENEKIHLKEENEESFFHFLSNGYFYNNLDGQIDPKSIYSKHSNICTNAAVFLRSLLNLNLIPAS
ncbi:MAG: hypothetical protein LBT46_00700 [Planctomycetaceae bacterium]|nr:hypothetical protein [Planctomycetaceae bacterium]